MRIDIVCSSENHPVNRWLTQWVGKHRNAHAVRILRDKADCREGDILFLVSCTQLVEPDVLGRYRHAFVLHASDLPKGRGWSPHIWTILEGGTCITVSLLDAADSVDTGAIWAKRKFQVPKDALYDEINAALFDIEVALMDEALRLVAAGEMPESQPESGATYYRKRRPEDSELDVASSIAEQFDKLRVADPERYPAYFKIHGCTYIVRIEKAEKNGRS